MLGLNRILLATDFSASATAALLYAAALTRLSHATLQVLHVVDTRVTALARWTEVLHSPRCLRSQNSRRDRCLAGVAGAPGFDRTERGGACAAGSSG